MPKLEYRRYLIGRWSEIEAYVAVVESGSLAAASRRLNIAVSAVSRRIVGLENRLGVRLANRSTKGFSTTPAGQAYYEKCLRLVADLAEADAEAVGEVAAVSGLLRIAAPLTFGVKHMAPALHRYAEQYPSMRFDIDFSDRRVDIAEEGFDLALRIGKLEDSSLIAKRLFKIHHVVAASPDFWNKNGRPKTPEDLEGLPALTYKTGSDPAQWLYTSPQGTKGAVRVDPRFNVTNGEFATNAAVEGLGVVLEPTFVCCDELRAGKLEAALADYAWLDMAGYAIWPPGRPLPARVRQLIDYLSDEFADPAPWDCGLALGSS